MSSIELKKAGLKVTHPRIKVLSILENTDNHHMSAEDVYKALLSSDTEIGLATVYRVLTQFEAAGIVKRHHFDGGQAIFEIDNGDNHDHMVCMKTGRLEEFKDAVIDERLQAIAKEHGFKASHHSIILYGVYADEE